MKYLIIFCLIVAFFSLSAMNAAAEEDKSLGYVFKNAYYGAAIGGLLGTAVMIFSDRPADHFNYIAYGLAGGVIAGTFYGLATPSRSLSEIDHGRLKIDFPRFEVKDIPQMDPSDRKKSFLFLPLMKYPF